MNVSYRVITKTSKPDKLVSIRIRLITKLGEDSTASGFKIPFKYWTFPKNGKGQHGLSRTNWGGKPDLKISMDKLELFVKENYSPDIRLKELVLLFHNPGEIKKDPKAIYTWADNWINNLNLATRTIYKYKAAIISLKEFDSRLTWEKITLPFYDRYIKHLKEKEQARNTIADRIKVIKAICNAAYIRKVHYNDAYKSFPMPTEESSSVYLDEKELQRIFICNLYRHPHLDRIRDLFLIGCWTGCRFGDFSKITSGINGNYIHLEQGKTRTKVVIPLHPVVKSILKKYDGKLPNIISNQKFNVYVKLVAKAARIKDDIQTSITKGNSIQYATIKKFDMISSHTGRRSFATNLYKSGFPSISIMKITGHKTEKSFMKYIKVTNEENAELLLKHWNRKED